MNPFNFFTKPKIPQNGILEDFYSLKINSLAGKPVDFNTFKGKHILIVNVASKCGFTPQYKELEELSNIYKDRLIVIGVPCNQFGSQESGTAKEIESFCELNYGVSFLITEKIEVKGKQQHQLYKWLTNKSKNGNSNSTVKWNFQKYLINNKGQLINYFYSTTKPLSKKITKHLIN